MEVLFSFTGNHDPYAGSDDEYGPVLSLLQERKFDRVYLFCTGSDYMERARTVEKIGREELGCADFRFIDLVLESVVDYEEIFRRLSSTIDQIMEQLDGAQPAISVLLDPGTPQMQTCWFLLAKSGSLPARLLQGIPARFAGGAYKSREVRLDSPVFPEVRIGKGSGRRGEGVPADSTWFRPEGMDTVVGESSAFREALAMAERAASYDISILIRGETGSGKGVVASRIHERSARRGKPFLSVNCASIAPALAESELFGHAKGSFTGAQRDRLGLFRSAEGGTVFLDEVGDLPMELQPKLLRVLEDGTMTPVGSDRPQKVDVRVIAATNRNLEELIDAGTFRRDLYERIAAFVVTIPPLRERPEDIPLLVKEFIDQWNGRYGERKGIGEETMQLLREYPWPGNVRELQNAVKTLCASGQSDSIGPELLPPTILAHFNRRALTPEILPEIPAGGINLKAILFQLEKRFYEEAIKKAGGNMEKAAGFLGLNGPAFRKAARERLGLPREGGTNP